MIILLVGMSSRVAHSVVLLRPAPPFILASPIKHKLSVTGSFGELRNNHFHAGVDIRSNKGVDGDLILAAGNGYIKKVKIDSKNYGNSVEIEHENGFTTLYGHLDRFRIDLEEKIKMEQYHRQENELELEFGPNEFKVNAGDSIATMGNTGDSRGAHLHFELRLSGTNEVVDPANYGLEIDDNIAPQFRRMKLYGFDLDGQTVSEKLIASSKINNLINIPGDVFALSVEAFDRTNNSWRLVGIKSLKLYIDDGLFYSFSLDQWSLKDTRYINAHLDYKGLHYGRFHRCFRLQGNKIPIYQTVENDGFFYIGDGNIHKVKIIIGDAKDNETIKEFEIRNTAYAPCSKKCYKPFNIDFEKEWNYDFGFGQFYLPEGSVYSLINCSIDTLSNSFKNAQTPWIGISPSSEPLHNKLQISLSPQNLINDYVKSKCYIALKRGSSFVCIGGEWSNDNIVASSKSLGYFSILTDTIPPRLLPKNFRFNMTGKSKLSFTMSDNVTDITDNRPGIKYNATIDGQWIILKHDLKTRTISHEFESWLGTGTHELVVTLEDSRQNKKDYRYQFYR